MPKANSLSTESFEDLLSLLSADRDEAGVKYEEIRSGLVRFFDFKGCADAESLADETINRVALKTDAYDTGRTKRLAAYFYGFAANVLLEHLRSVKHEVPLLEHHDSPRFESDPFEAEKRDTCLSLCLEKLDGPEREMIVKYYAYEGEEKVRARERLCDDFDYSIGALHTRIFRIKSTLRVCMDRCMKKS